MKRAIHAFRARVTNGVSLAQCGIVCRDAFVTDALWRVNCAKCRDIFVEVEQRKAKLQVRLTERMNEVGRRMQRSEGFPWGDILENITLVLAGVMVQIERDPQRLRRWESLWPEIRRDADRQLREALRMPSQALPRKPPAREVLPEAGRKRERV